MIMEVQQATQFKVPYEQEWTEDKAVFIVKDGGLYLFPSHVTENKQPVYAHGFEPRSLFSRMLDGSDFIERIHLSDRVLNRIHDGWELVLGIEDDAWCVHTERRSMRGSV
jgi:hypothetical protein